MDKTNSKFIKHDCLRSIAFIVGIVIISFTNIVAAASKTEIDVRVENALTTFNEKTDSGKELANRAVGMLVFPKVYKAGIGIGGEYGEGALLVGGKAVDYYNTTSASIGFQLGAQARSEIILFMNQDVLTNFRNDEGWEAGVDGSVAIATFGAGGEIDSTTAQESIIGFIFSNKGLMYNLSIEGSKFTKIKK